MDFKAADETPKRLTIVQIALADGSQCIDLPRTGSNAFA
jgi:hypothetical protein